jgi:hypothetical protein
MNMENKDYAGYCLGVDLADIDPDISEIISLEEERQARKFVFIPSESIAPKAVLLMDEGEGARLSRLGFQVARWSPETLQELVPNA